MTNQPGDTVAALRLHAGELRALASYPSTSNTTGLDLLRIRTSLEAIAEQLDSGAGRGPYHVEHIPAQAASRVGAEVRENWRITDSDDNRVGTCYDPVNAERIVAALNGSGITRADARASVEIAAANDMLDNLGVPAGPLLARIGLAVIGVPPKLEPQLPRATFSVSRHPVTVAEIRRRATAGAPVEPLADADAVKIPDPTAVLAALVEDLTGEEAFKIFDALKLLPDDADEVRSWVLTDPDDVMTMVRRCCTIAFDANRLNELAERVDKTIERIQRGARQ